jgi:hypothetical protein
MQPDVVTLQVRALAALDLEGVRAAWRVRYGAPPRLRSVQPMKRLLAWRIQAEAWGGLDAPQALEHRLEVRAEPLTGCEGRAGTERRSPRGDGDAGRLRLWRPNLCQPVRHRPQDHRRSRSGSLAR